MRMNKTLFSGLVAAAVAVGFAQRTVADWDFIFPSGENPPGGFASSSGVGGGDAAEDFVERADKLFKDQLEQFDQRFSYITGGDWYRGTEALNRYKKEKKFKGVVYDKDQQVYGTVVIEVVSVNRNMNMLKLSATIENLEGKKFKSKRSSCIVNNDGSLRDRISFKCPVGDVDLTIVPQESGSSFLFRGNGRYGHVMIPADLGGEIDSRELAFSVNADDGDLPVVHNGYRLLTAFPDGEPVHVSKNGRKWSCDKAGRIKYKKVRNNGETEYELVGFNDEKRPNVSGLRLSYNYRSGKFSGSFKMYASNADTVKKGKAPKMKVYSARVTGFMINQIGIGVAKVKVGERFDRYPVQIDCGNCE